LITSKEWQKHLAENLRYQIIMKISLHQIEMAANQKIAFALVCLFLACDLVLGQQQAANSSDAESDVAG